ncbi:MAG: ATP-binding protein, partial [Bacteroidetes bacterium]|nr:ATP-binding protein [Bacteroidota bacterium]
GESPKPDHTVQLSLLNQVSELDKIALKVEELSEAWNIPPKVGMEVNLVLEELFTNIVFYAFDDNQEHRIMLEFRLKDESQLEMRLEDDGKAFNLLEKKINDAFDLPVEERPIGGLGIHFVKEMMSSVDYQRKDNKNVIILGKNFKSKNKD